MLSMLLKVLHKTTSEILALFQEKTLLLRNLGSYSVHSSQFYSQYKSSYKVYLQKSNFVAGFTFHKAEQYYTQLQKSVPGVSVGRTGKPEENVAEHYRGDVYKDSEIP